MTFGVTECALRRNKTAFWAGPGLLVARALVRVLVLLLVLVVPVLVRLRTRVGGLQAPFVPQPADTLLLRRPSRKR